MHTCMVFMSINIVTQVIIPTDQLIHLPHICRSLRMTMPSRFFILESIFLSYLFIVSSSVAHMLGNETDRLALLAFKSQMSLDSQWVLGSWQTSSNFCKWEGVICGHRPTRVIELKLDFYGLAGSISPHIGNLSFLRNLNLSNNLLYGQIPQEVGGLSRLQKLGMGNNNLSGPLPASLEKCRSLQNLHLDHNKLTGSVPKQVFRRSSILTDITLSNNYLTGSLPLEVGNLKFLRNLDISENAISGQIPKTLGGCLVLEELYLQGNFFFGSIPASFGYLKVIKDIDLSRNSLVGKISKKLEGLLALQRLNLSFNYFEGAVPTKGIFLNTSAFSIMGNDMLCGGITNLHLPKCSSKKNRMLHVAKLILCVLIPSLFVVVSLVALYTRKQSNAKPVTEDLGNKLPQVSYKELYDATNGFSSEVLIGMGSYGSVYKGVLREYESVIAVKVLNLMTRGASKNFVAESEVLKKVRHRNLLKVLTVCSSVDFDGNDFKALIFDFMPKGSLESWLHPTSNGQYPSRNMGLLQRLNIAIDIAFALDYLHNHLDTPIVHCDLKPSNVLLNQDMVACLGDFGLAKFLAKNTHNCGTINESVTISLRGTIGYIPPEYGMGVSVSTKGDVYSYEILILEMLTGKRPTDPMFNDNITLHSFCNVNVREQLRNLLDTHILIGETSEALFLVDIEGQQYLPKERLDCLDSIMKIGIACSSELIVDRMEIKDVLAKMQAIREAFIRSENKRQWQIHESEMGRTSVEHWRDGGLRVKFRNYQEFKAVN